MRSILCFSILIGLGLQTISGCSGPKRQPAPPAKVADLLPMLDSDDPIIRSLACSSLGLVGAGNPEAIAALERTLDDPDEAVRKVAESSLAKLHAGE